jgi:AAA domain
LVLCLAICVATGRKWLGTFETVQGDVLIIDNELHGETMASRIPRVAGAMGMIVDDFCDHLFVENVRGRLRSIFDMEAYFAEIEPGRFKIIILDAFYRFLPAGSDENDNSTMANVYNLLDRVADRLGCCFVLIHHTSKGNQSAKEITAVGSGAGSQSRATDTHLIIRQHENDGAVVLDAAVRSWAPIEPICLRWAFPLFNPADDLDPTQLRRENYRKRRDGKPVEDVTPKIEWTTAAFVQRFLNSEPRTESQILVDAQSDLSERKAKRFLDVAVESGSVHRWTYADRKKPHRFSTIPQPVIETGNGVQK